MFLRVFSEIETEKTLSFTTAVLKFNAEACQIGSYRKVNDDEN